MFSLAFALREKMLLTHSFQYHHYADVVGLPIQGALIKNAVLAGKYNESGSTLTVSHGNMSAKLPPFCVVVLLELRVVHKALINYSAQCPQERTQ